VAVVAALGDGVQTAVFHGSYSDTVDLLAAVDNSCADPEKCTKDLRGRVSHVCAAHRALLDQRFLDGLLYIRHNKARFQAGEWDACLPYPT
jgi:hypothetical protein